VCVCVCVCVCVNEGGKVRRAGGAGLATLTCQHCCDIFATMMGAACCMWQCTTNRRWGGGVRMPAMCVVCILT
jgi:hypothetical protein